MGSKRPDKTSDSVCAELQRQWDSFAPLDRPDSLWIACRERSLDRVLDQVRECGSVLTLRWPELRLSSDPRARDERLAGIDFAIQRLGVSELVILGHSQCDCVREATPVPATRKRADAEDSPNFYDRMIQRVIARQKSLAAAQQNVIEQLARLTEESCLRDTVAEGRLRLLGMFYLAESDLLLVLDERTGEFLPLGQMLAEDDEDVPTADWREPQNLSSTPITDKFVCSFPPTFSRDFA